MAIKKTPIPANDETPILIMTNAIAIITGNGIAKPIGKNPIENSNLVKSVPINEVTLLVVNSFLDSSLVLVDFSNKLFVKIALTLEPTSIE